MAAGNDRFLFTSTTSLMVRDDVRAGAGDAGAWWMDEDFGPIEPRNIYGITKLAAEQAVRLVHREHGIAALILRTGRFFPEDDDTHAVPSGPNLKANELLGRRLTVEDAAAAERVAPKAARGFVRRAEAEGGLDHADASDGAAAHELQQLGDLRVAAVHERLHERHARRARRGDHPLAVSLI